MKQIVFVISCLTCFVSLSAQSTDLWSAIEIEDPFFSGERITIPNHYQTYHLDLQGMKQWLAQAPMEFEANPVECIVEIPFPNGQFEAFKVWNSPVFEVGLANKYPQIQSFTGYGLNQPNLRIKLDAGPNGFHAMVLGPGYSVFIDPYSKGNLSEYMSYFRKDAARAQTLDWTCEAIDLEHNHNSGNTNTRGGDCQLRTYRLALACTGEYGTYHGGTIPSVLAAMNTTMNRVNGIYERDFAVRMNIIANNDLLIYFNGGTDPYTNNNGGAMLSQNINNINTVIGSANYDVGHVFSTGGGGVAYLRAICKSYKAGGVTGLPNPIGDVFDVDYVSHEMGHQFGGNHTQNNSCNRNNSTAMEPGSASTIMGYAGICAPNVQSNSDDYFHAISMQEIYDYIVNGVGNNCANIVSISNNQPTASAGNDYTIPISTPFRLTGIATDTDVNDSLTHSWEQMDNAVASMPPQSTSTGGPAFRSLDPDTVPTRVFPNMDAIVNNNTPTWEVLASVGRTMNFRYTVRDNAANAGCTAEDDMVITVAGSAGPFLVNYPNAAGITWTAGNTETVTWNVASTDLAPVSCANVDIVLSLDGGYTYPVVLQSNVPNIGSAAITVPNYTTTTARIQVFCSDNVFFDISNNNFEIQGVLPLQLLEFSGNSQSAGIMLNWLTGQVDGSYGMELYRADLNGRFQTIYQLSNVQANQGYEFLDLHAHPGSNQYQLWLTDINGQSRLLSQVSVIFSGKWFVEISPNPASDQLMVRYPIHQESVVEMEIWNVLGQQVLKESYVAEMGVQEQLLSLEGWNAGLYILRLSNGRTTTEHRFLKQ